MIDTHAHLDFRDFDEDREATVARARAAGVDTIINIATDFASCERVLALADRYASMYAVLGVHPHDAKTWKGQTSAEQLKRLAARPKAVGIGEIGLDYYRDHSPRDVQRRAFQEQVAAAHELNLPMVIHNRDAFADIFAIIRETSPHLRSGVFHCFSGTTRQAFEAIELGFCLSVNGILTYKNAGMAEVARAAPLERLLLETDCPFLSPQPHRGRRNEPAHVALIAGELARIRRQSLEVIVSTTDANAARLFGIPPPSAHRYQTGRTNE